LHRHPPEIAAVGFKFRDLQVHFSAIFGPLEIAKLWVVMVWRGLFWYRAVRGY
jgi:hypothetical protein